MLRAYGGRFGFEKSKAVLVLKGVRLLALALPKTPGGSGYWLLSLSAVGVRVRRFVPFASMRNSGCFAECPASQSPAPLAASA